MPNPSDPICAPATPLMPSAVAVIRISGDNLAHLLAPFVDLPPSRIAALRWLRWGGYSERALAIFFPAPSSYTGQDVVEFQTHGNPLLARRLLEQINKIGIRLAEPGEFTQRAIMNGKQSLLDAEALHDLICAASDTQIRQAQARAGGIPRWILDAKARIAPWVAHAEASVDYGEEENIPLDMGAIKAEMAKLNAVFHVEQKRSSSAKWLRDGVRAAIVGRPNAGKSTLFNALAGEDRAIVSEIPGTTRDVIETKCEWAGLPLCLFDTAGLREATDPIERLGIDRVWPVLEQADIVLYLVPIGEPLGDEMEYYLGAFREKTLTVRTKCDVADGLRREESGVAVSAAAGDLGALEKAIRRRFLGELSPDACLGAMATQRQRMVLADMISQSELLLGLPNDCPAELPASLLQGMWGLLLRLTGEDRADMALNEMFSGFCLGK